MNGQRESRGQWGKALCAEIRRRLGLWLCSRGRHAPLHWVRSHKRPVPIDSVVMEMFAASGFMRLATWNGWCPRCGRAIEWADHKPHDYAKDWP